jgi:transcription antitermination factor NusG
MKGKHDLSEGDTVRVKKGAFAAFTGRVVRLTTITKGSKSR